MGKIWMPGGGGGADLDVITAGAGDVLVGKVIVDKDGEPLTGTLALSGNASDAQVLSGQSYYNLDPKTKRTGTMPNRGAVSQALGINGTYTIPAGYHNGSGKVTQSIATLGGQTINPTASQQTVSSSGKYMTGNVVVNAVSNLTAANIKKGAVVGGVTGTWEGYVPGAQDLYYRGNNVAGFIAGQKATLDAGQITIGPLTSASQYGYLYTNNSISTVGRTWINMQVNITSHYNDLDGDSIYISMSFGGQTLKTIIGSGYGEKTYSFNVSAIQASSAITITVNRANMAIYRMWLS